MAQHSSPLIEHEECPGITFQEAHAEDCDKLVEMLFQSDEQFEPTLSWINFSYFGKHTDMWLKIPLEKRSPKEIHTEISTAINNHHDSGPPSDVVFKAVKDGHLIGFITAFVVEADASPHNDADAPPSQPILRKPLVLRGNKRLKGDIAATQLNPKTLVEEKVEKLIKHDIKSRAERITKHGIKSQAEQAPFLRKLHLLP